MNKPYAVTVFGATGYTGSLVAESLARYAPAGTRWAIAGRTRAKLEACSERLAELPCPPSGVLLASSNDRPSLDALCAASEVIASTVGPFARLGMPLAEACVAGGSDYVDSTGEPLFVAQLIERLDARAKEAGVRLVPCSAFESLPIDYGAWLTARELPQDAELEVRSYIRAKGGISGGTWNTILEAMAEPKTSLAAMKALRPQGGRPCKKLRDVHWVHRLASWTCPMPTIDPLIALRSAGHVAGYGRSFTYGHFVQVPNRAVVAAGALGIGAVSLAARVRPLRSLLGRMLPAGSGPDSAARAEGHYRLDVFGSGGGERVHTRLWGTRDPGYVETGHFVAAAALTLCLKRTKLPDTYGVLTPVAALGLALLPVLKAAGIKFHVEHEGTSALRRK